MASGKYHHYYDDNNDSKGSYRELDHIQVKNDESQKEKEKK